MTSITPKTNLFLPDREEAESIGGQEVPPYFRTPERSCWRLPSGGVLRVEHNADLDLAPYIRDAIQSFEVRATRPVGSGEKVEEEKGNGGDKRKQTASPDPYVSPRPVTPFGPPAGPF